LYGETTGETDEFGLPERYNWAVDYRGPAIVVYGHTPIPNPEWLNRTINIDNGAVFGGKLTALKYPEKELVSVQAKRMYSEPVRPIRPTAKNGPSELSAQQRYDDLLEAEDVLGKRFISTELRSNVTIREENAVAALEVMSRFAANPKWLIYLPPTMSPAETSQKDGFLEYPKEAFEYYRSSGISKVVCEQKHMGSRAVVIACKNEDTALKRFGISGEYQGIVYTRTGRRFFEDPIMERSFLDRVHLALSQTEFWNDFKTDWVCLDCEMMPWSAKAQELLKTQYAAVGTAAETSLQAAIIQIEKTAARSDLEIGFMVKPESHSKEFDIGNTLQKFQERLVLTGRYVDAYRRYCWKISALNDLKLAPFHLLATEGRLYIDKDHEWHMETLAKVCQADTNLLLKTPYKIVDVTDPEQTKEGMRWWEEITSAGAEGMVVKPFDFVSKGRKGIVQPALKCRGQEYLRIIYGPEYTLDENLSRLRIRDLKAKRSLALREFALGVEGLKRFINNEPLRRTHECVFGVLALESEPVDPRL
jgi:protein phosphatase